MPVGAVVVNGFHLAMLFFPVFIYAIPPAMTVPWFKYVFLLMILIPLHWPLFDNKCALTVLSMKMGWLEDTGSDNAFSEAYLRWLYEPLLTLCGLGWTQTNIDKAVYVHWIVNFVLLWYYLCFRAGRATFCG